MVLIVGGAYQGKRAYALHMGYGPEQIVTDVAGKVRVWMADGKDPDGELACAADGWKDAAVLLEDIGCGVVPVDTEDRAWREAVGRCGVYLASRAEKVIRVFCGIGTVIRDA